LQEAPSHDAKVNSYTYSERKNRKKDGAYIDKDGVARTFDRKKISRKRGNAITPFSFILSCRSRTPRPFVKKIIVIFLGLTVSLEVQEGYGISIGSEMI
jgi:hypothetical protein